MVHLDLRHLGEAKLRERLPQIYELAEEFLGIDPAHEPIPVLPGGALHDGRHPRRRQDRVAAAGPVSAGECSSVGIHGANRLGSNSLTELFVFGKVAGDEAAAFAKSVPISNPRCAREAGRRGAPARAGPCRTDRRHGERIATLRDEMAQSMESGCGIYRTGTDDAGDLRQARRAEGSATGTLDARRSSSKVWNTEWLLGDRARLPARRRQAMAHSALKRKESRGAHQRLDGFEQRDDVNFLKHTLAYYRRRRRAAHRAMAT